MAFLEAQGVSFFWSSAAGATTIVTTDAGSKVNQVVSIGGPSGSGGKIDVTNLGSTAKQFLMGLRDEGEITLDVIYDPADAGQVAMFDYRAARTKNNWGIKLSDGSSNMIKGYGFCTGFSLSGAVDDAVKASITVAITGAVEVSVGTTIAQDTSV